MIIELTECCHAVYILQALIGLFISISLQLREFPLRDMLGKAREKSL
jgi:hypothetical protein